MNTKKELGYQWHLNQTSLSLRVYQIRVSILLSGQQLQQVDLDIKQ